MSKAKQTEASSAERRKTLEHDVEAFLKAGNRIQVIDDGVSAQDPQGKVRPLRRGAPKNDAQAAEAESKLNKKPNK